ncbi:MAG: transglutaminase-like domain-containing protein, partial [Firmicutes bacterium]|nr:transglutaminase-like domain-containing protein [Bacillota bacterium]
GINKGVKLDQPAYGYVEADTRIDLRLKSPNDMEEIVVIVEKGSERSDQPLTGKKGIFSTQVWLPFGPGEYTVTVCSPPRDSTLEGLVSFKARNTGLQDVRDLAPIDWIDWDHPDILTLARGLSQEDQMATVTAIHDWIAQNINYDMAAYSLIGSGQGSAAPKKASAVLQSRSGVCEHFSRLAAALCRANKIPARVVRGYARREGENWSSEPNHAWNEVLVNGRWITLDVTWDAGYIEGDQFINSFTRTYLDPDPAFFTLTHRKNDAA